MRLGVAADHMIMRMVMPFEASGKKDTLRSFVVATKDSQYTYNKMGGQEAGEVSAFLRPHLAREYARTRCIRQGTVPGESQAGH